LTVLAGDAAVEVLRANPQLLPAPGTTHLNVLGHGPTSARLRKWQTGTCGRCDRTSLPIAYHATRRLQTPRGLVPMIACTPQCVTLTWVVAVIDASVVSLALIVCVPNDFSLTLNVCVPLSAAVKV